MKSTFHQLLLLFVIQISVALQPLHADGRDEDVLSVVGGEGIRTVLSSVFTANCVTILITDGKTSSSSLLQVVRSIEGGSGFGIFEVETDNWKTNSTQEHFSRVVKQIMKLRQNSPCLAMIMASEDATFLAELAHHVDEGRLLLWETKVLAITRLYLKELRSLLNSRWVFSMTNAMVLNLEDIPGSVRCGVYSYLPYSKDGGSMVRVGTWTPMQGLVLLTHLQLYPQKYRNFYGANVGLTVWPFMPYFMAVEEPVPNGSNYTGRDYIMLETLERILNFTIEFIPTKSWDEVILLVKQRVSFMSPMKLAIMPHLLKDLDFTTAIEPATLTFSMAKPTLKPRWQSLYYPLTDSVWASILVMMVIMPPIFIVVNRIGGYQKRNRRTAGTVILEVTGTLLGQNYDSGISSITSGKLVVGSWLLFTFIMGTAYRGNLTAFLTIPKYPPRVETLSQLLARNTKVAMPQDTIDFYNGFKQSPSGEFRTLSERVTFVDSFREGLQMAETSNSAYMYERRFMELMIARHFTPLRQASKLYVARQNVWPGYSAWPIIRDAPFKPILDQYIQIFNEAGLVEKWGDDVVEDARRISRKKNLKKMKEEEAKKGIKETILGKEEIENEGSNSQALTIIHMQGPLLLLVLGLASAGLVFGAEVLITWFLPGH